MLPSRHHATVLCTAALAACGADAGTTALAPRLDVIEMSAEASGPSVTGHISIIQQPSGELRTFSFQARVMPDGTVQGHFVNHNRQGDAVNHGEIDCLVFIDENTAVLSGPIWKHTNPAFEGGTTVFRVQDNGEGADDPADRVSMLSIFVPGPAPDCTTLTQATAPILGGNIQVRP